MSLINQNVPTIAPQIDTSLPDARVGRSAPVPDAAADAAVQAPLALPGVASEFVSTALLGLRRPSSSLDVSIALAEAAANLDGTMAQARSLATIASFVAALSAARSLDPTSARERVAADLVLQKDAAEKQATFEAEHDRLKTALEGPVEQLSEAKGKLSGLQEEAKGEVSEERAEELVDLIDAAAREVGRLEGEVGRRQEDLRIFANAQLTDAYGVLDREVQTLPDGSAERTSRAALRDEQAAARTSLGVGADFADVESALSGLETLYAQIGEHLQARITVMQGLATQFGALALFARVQAATVLSGEQAVDTSLNRMKDDLLEEILQVLVRSSGQTANLANPLLRGADAAEGSRDDNDTPEPPSRPQILAAAIAVSISDLLSALDQQRELSLPSEGQQGAGRRVLLEI